MSQIPRPQCLPTSCFYFLQLRPIPHLRTKEQCSIEACSNVRSEIFHAQFNHHYTKFGGMPTPIALYMQASTISTKNKHSPHASMTEGTFEIQRHHAHRVDVVGYLIQRYLDDNQTRSACEELVHSFAVAELLRHQSAPASRFRHRPFVEPHPLHLCHLKHFRRGKQRHA